MPPVNPKSEITELLDAILARAEAATKGPWAKDWGRVRGDQCETICLVPNQLDWDREHWIADGTFIAAARTGYPAAVKALLWYRQRFQFELELIVPDSPTKLPAIKQLMFETDAELAKILRESQPDLGEKEA